MAIAITNLVSSGDTTDRGSGDPYTVASATFVTGRYYLLGVVGNLVDTPETPTVTTTGVTWSLEATVDFHTIASPDCRLCLFSGTGSGTATTAVEFTGTQTGARWTLNEITGHNTGSPIVQKPTNKANSSLTFSISLSAFADATNNAMFAVVVKSSTEATNKEAGHTLLSDGSTTATTTLHMTAVWQVGEDTSVDFSTAGSRDWGGVGLEIAVASAGDGLGNKLEGLLGGKLIGKV